MIYNQFYNLSCYEEFEIKCALMGISKLDVLKEIGHQVNDYYFFVSNDGIFNWFDLDGNRIVDPWVLKKIKSEYIPDNITKCIIPDSVTSISSWAFSYCKSLTSIIIPDGVTSISSFAFSHCISLTSITIPNSVTYICNTTFHGCNALKEVIFKGKTLEEVKQMDNYPFEIEDENVFKIS